MTEDERPDLSAASIEDLRTMVEAPTERQRLDALMELTDRAYGRVPEPERVGIMCKARQRTACLEIKFLTIRVRARGGVTILVPISFRVELNPFSTMGLVNKAKAVENQNHPISRSGRLKLRQKRCEGTVQ